MRTVTTEEEVAALPDRSVVVLSDLPKTDEKWFFHTSIYQKFGNRWTEMDPSDRDDGEWAWDNKDISVIAKRDLVNIYVAFNPDDLGGIE